MRQWMSLLKSTRHQPTQQRHIAPAEEQQHFRRDRIVDLSIGRPQLGEPSAAPVCATIARSASAITFSIGWLASRSTTFAARAAHADIRALPIEVLVRRLALPCAQHFRWLRRKRATARAAESTAAASVRSARLDPSDSDADSPAHRRSSDSRPTSVERTSFGRICAASSRASSRPANIMQLAVVPSVLARFAARRLGP